MNQDDCEGFSLKLFFSKILSLGGACKKQSVSLFVLNMVFVLLIISYDNFSCIAYFKTVHRLCASGQKEETVRVSKAFICSIPHIFQLMAALIISTYRWAHLAFYRSFRKNLSGPKSEGRVQRTERATTPSHQQA